MKAPRKLRVAVIGCGSAGPAAATLLARAGHEVHLFDKAPHCLAVGAGFLLQPSGMHVLRELGILESVLAHSSRVTRLHVLEKDRADLMQLLYAEVGENLFGAGLHRPVLLHYLLQAMAQAGVIMHWNCEIISAQQTNQIWNLTTADQRELLGFDFLIIADGARSRLRKLVDDGGIDRGYAWGAHWFIGENDGSFEEEELYQMVHGTKILSGFLPTGRDLEKDQRLVSMFWSIKIADDVMLRQQPLEQWKDLVSATVPRAEKFLHQIQDWSQILTARYGDVRMRRWHGNAVVVLGDAAHAMSPQLGQGVNLALADAHCLASCMEKFSLQEALDAYTKRRRFALRYYQFSTRSLTPWFQSDYEWLTPFRRMMFRTSQHIPIARKLMTATMAGIIGH